MEMYGTPMADGNFNNPNNWVLDAFTGESPAGRAPQAGDSVHLAGVFTTMPSTLIALSAFENTSGGGSGDSTDYANIAVTTSLTLGRGAQWKTSLTPGVTATFADQANTAITAAISGGTNSWSGPGASNRGAISGGTNTFSTAASNIGAISGGTNTFSTASNSGAIIGGTNKFSAAAANSGAITGGTVSFGGTVWLTTTGSLPFGYQVGNVKMLTTETTITAGVITTYLGGHGYTVDSTIAAHWISAGIAIAN